MSPYFRALRQKVGHAALIYPCAFAAIFNDRRELLLVRKHGSAIWGFPGGGIEPDETILEALAREVREEIQAEIAVEHTLAIYSSPTFDMQYENGDAIHPIMFLFGVRIVGALAFAPNDEIAEIGYFPASALPLMRPCCQRKAHDAFDPPLDLIDPIR